MLAIGSFSSAFCAYISSPVSPFITAAAFAEVETAEAVIPDKSVKESKKQTTLFKFATSPLILLRGAVRYYRESFFFSFLNTSLAFSSTSGAKANALSKELSSL